jgi:hypothetical protein
MFASSLSCFRPCSSSTNFSFSAVSKASNRFFFSSAALANATAARRFRSSSAVMLAISLSHFCSSLAILSLSAVLKASNRFRLSSSALTAFVLWP